MPRPDRGQRRRQVDADQDPERLPPSGQRARSSSTGRRRSLRSVDHARSLGIDTVYQDLALIPTLSVAHNMFLNRELTSGVGPFRWLANGEMRRRARTLHRRHRDPHPPLGALGGRNALGRPASGNRDRTLRPFRCAISCSWTSRSRRWAPRRGDDPRPHPRPEGQVGTR